MPQIVKPETLKAAQKFKYLYSLYQENKDLISVGAYSAGSNPELDLAVRLQPVMKSFLAQGLDESHSLEDSENGLNMIINEAMGMSRQTQTG
jgi:flagellum-specific ATP synthase